MNIFQMAFIEGGVRKTEQIKNISSRQNDIIKKVAITKKNPTRASYIIEGTKFVLDTPTENIKALFALYPDKYPELTERLLKSDIPVYAVTEAVMDKLCDASSGQELLAEVFSEEKPLPDRVVILDTVQDSGNVGTVIRTALAFGYGCVLSEKCASPYSVKTVRSSAGAVTKCPIEAGKLTDIINRLKADGYAVYSSELDETAERLCDIKPPKRFAVIVGNEGAGVTEEVSRLADKKVYIPIAGVDSLNAAVCAGILMNVLMCGGDNG